MGLTYGLRVFYLVIYAVYKKYGDTGDKKSIILLKGNNIYNNNFSVPIIPILL